jgi:hypothetical protein
MKRPSIFELRVPPFQDVPFIIVNYPGRRQSSPGSLCLALGYHIQPFQGRIVSSRLGIRFGPLDAATFAHQLLAPAGRDNLRRRRSCNLGEC